MRPSKKEYEEVLHMLKDAAERLDDELLEPVHSEPNKEEENGSSEGQLIGFRFARGNHMYVIHGRRENKAEYINITFPYNFLLDFSRVLMLKQHEGDVEELEGVDINVEQGLNELQDFATDDPQRYDAMRAHLIDLLSSPHTSYAIGKQNGVITSIESTTRVFPYKDDFSIEELNKAIQSVIGVGVPARNHLQRAHGIAPSTKVPEATKPQEDVEEADARTTSDEDRLHYIN